MVELFEHTAHVGILLLRYNTLAIELSIDI